MWAAGTKLENEEDHTAQENFWTKSTAAHSWILWDENQITSWHLTTECTRNVQVECKETLSGAFFFFKNSMNLLAYFLTNLKSQHCLPEKITSSCHIHEVGK